MKYAVAYDDHHHHVHIIDARNDPEPGFEKIGEFDLAVADDDTNHLEGGKLTNENGEHIFITKAKEILSDNDVSDFGNITFEDKASNAPNPEQNIRSTKEVEHDVRFARSENLGADEGDTTKPEDTADAPVKDADDSDTKAKAEAADPKAPNKQDKPATRKSAAKKDS